MAYFQYHFKILTVLWLFFVCSLTQNVTDKHSLLAWDGNIIDVGFHKVRRIEESVDVRKVREQKPAKWHVAKEVPEAFIAVTGDTVILKSLNHTLSTLTCGGVAGVSVTVQGRHNTVLVVAVEDDEDNYLLYVDLKNATLVESARVPINHRVDLLAAWRDQVVVSWKNQVELYRKGKDGLELLDANQMGGTIADLSCGRYLDGWLIAVAVPSKNRVNGFYVASDLFWELTDVAARAANAVSVFVVGSNTMVAVAGDEAGVWLVRPDRSMALVTAQLRLGAVQRWLPVPLARHVLLLATKPDNNTLVLESDGFYNFKQMGTASVFCQKGDDSCNKIVPDLERSSAGPDTIIIPTRNSEVIHFTLKYQVEIEAKSRRVIMKEIEQLQSQLDTAIQMQSQREEDVMNKVESIDGAHVFEAPWTVGQLDVSKGDFAPLTDDDEFQVDEWSFAGRSDWSDEDLQIDMEHLSDFVKSLQETILNVKVMLNDILTDKQENVAKELPNSIFGQLAVKGKVKAKNLIVENINGQPALQWADDCFRTDRPALIQGTKFAPSVESTNFHFNNIGEIPAEQLVYASDDIVIKGGLTMAGKVLVTGDVTLPPNGTVNGFHLNDDLMLMNTILKGPTPWPALENVEVTGAAQLGILTVDGRSAIMPVHFSPHHIETAIQHPHVDNVITHDLFADNINGIPLEQLLPQPDDHQQMIVEELNIEYLNGVKFPEGFILTNSNQPISITGKKTFKSLRTKTLKTSFGSLAALIARSNATSDESAKDILKSSARNEGVNYDSDTTHRITYVFDNLRVKTIRTDMVNNDTRQSMADKSNNTVVEKKPSSARKRCRPKDVEPSSNEIWNENEILDNTLSSSYLAAKVIEVYGSITTSDSATGLKLEKYANYLSKTKDQDIPARLITDTLRAVNLTTNELVASLPSRSLSQVAAGDIRKLHVNGQLHVGVLHIEDSVHIDHLHVNGTLDGVNFTAMYHDSVRRDSPNVFIRGEKTFSNGLSAESVNTFALNGRRPSAIATLYGDHIFHGPVVFRAPVRFAEDVHATGYVNDVNLTDLIGKVSSKFGAFVVQGDLEIEPGSYIDHVIAAGLVQGTNISEFLGQVVLKTEETIDLSHLNVTFNNSVSIAGALSVSEHLNDMNLTQFAEDIVLTWKSARLDSLTLQHSPIIRHLNVSGSLITPLLDGRSTDTWLEEAIYLNQENLEASTIRFEEMVVEGDVSTNLLNGMSVESLIPLKTDQVIPAPLFISRLQVLNSLNVDHTVNGYYLPDLYKDSLRHNGNQIVTGSKNFLSNVEVLGNVEVESIGGRKVADFATLYTDQNMTGLTVEGAVVVLGDLNTTGHVGGVPVSDWGKRVVLNGITKNISGSWTVMGNATAALGISGSGLVVNENLSNVSRAIEDKLIRTNEVNNAIHDDYIKQCKAVSDAANATEHQLRMLDMFEDIQGLQFHLPLQSALHYQVHGTDYVLVTFTGRCSARLYKWSQVENKLVKVLRVATGPIEVWTTLPSPDGIYLIASGPRSCHRNVPSSAVWEVSGTNFTELSRQEQFSDIIRDNTTSNAFHSVAPNGTVASWKIIAGALVKTSVAFVPSGKHNLVPLSLGVGLAVWDGDSIISVNSSISSRLSAASVAVGPKGLAALSDGLSRVELRRNGALVNAVHHVAPTDLHWIDLNAPGELYLIFASDHHRIYVYQFKGVAGLVKRSMLSYHSKRLLLMYLPYQQSTATPHILVTHDRVLHLLQVKMFGRAGIDHHLTC